LKLKNTIDLELKLDPSAVPPSLFRLAETNSGRRAGAPTKIRHYYNAETLWTIL